MNNLFDEFSKPSYTDWVNKLNQDLKGQSEELIQRKDEIEELNFNTYQHQDSVNTGSNPAFSNSSIRGNFLKDNRWENMITIHVSNEGEANKAALKALNMGVTSLRFVVQKDTNWNFLTEEIGLSYIETTFVISSIDTYFAILDFFGTTCSSIYFEIEPTALSDNDWSLLVAALKENPRYTLIANGYALQQCGATTWQEVGYCLAVAHESLSNLISNGLSIDEAAACIHFNIGAGAIYFYEIAKIRALRILWARILKEYQPVDSKTYYARITGLTGFMNKSLKDPYTNLLRQTTEAMSLLFSGVHAICVQPYDTYSTNKATTLSTRMASNIPLILQEESYLDKVIDPLGGSYAVEYLTNEIADKAWKLFQKIEQMGGISTSESVNYLTTAVEQKATLRKEQLANKKDSLIGITIFPNPTEEKNTWTEMENYLGMKQLIFEQSL